MAFTDRVSKYPNRYKVTNQNGTVTYVYIERADEPTNAGTPLNAENLNTLLNVDMTSATPEIVTPSLNADTLEGHRSSDFVTPAQMDNAINQKVVDIGASDMRTSTYDTNNDGIVNEADIAYKDENGRDITGLMQRYVIKLNKNGDISQTMYLVPHFHSQTSITRQEIHLCM